MCALQESKPGVPPAADPTDRRQPQVSDAVGAAFPMKESLRASSKYACRLRLI
jgi:hypothetical protein